MVEPEGDKCDRLIVTAGDGAGTVATIRGNMHG
jgi:hypothetical protein